MINMTISPLNSKATVFVFDFDGTIADTHLFICEISNRICQEFGYGLIDFNDIDKLKHMTAREIITHLRVPLFKIPAIVARAKKEVQKGIADIKLFPGIKEALIHLKSQQVTIGILSSNAMDNIKLFLDTHDLDIFDFIHPTIKIWSKDFTLREVLKKYGFNKSRLVYIGDEIRDIVAARACGIKVAAVGWGYNAPQALKDRHPDYFVAHPNDFFPIASIIKSL